MYSRPARRSHVRRRSFTLTLAVLVPALVAGACTFSSDPDEPSAAPTTSLSNRSGRVDITGLTVPRTALCSVLDQKAVTAALGGRVEDTAHYDNGDEVEVRPGHTDIVHEYGCTYLGPDGTAARVWVFARPVARHEARTLVRRARRGRGCTFPATVGDFGRLGLTSMCPVPTREQTRARLEGLFGDSWVGCEISRPNRVAGPSEDLARRAERWCTGVVATVGRPAG